uniref:Uncharacterized protein n=1 Tax=Aegilops tauschii subsp. strangulata TaxID=200361 RepID=A0A453BG34_AEGTS
LEVESSWRLLRQIGLHRHFRWLHGLRCMEAHLKELGASARPILPLARPPRPVLDGRPPRPPRPAAPRAMPPLRPGLETMHHLILAWPFARQLSCSRLHWLRLSCVSPDWWQTAQQFTPKPMRKGIASATLLVPWMIWIHRNDCVFNRGRPSANDL